MTQARALAVLVLCCALAFMVFARWPGLDIWVTSFFHDPESGFTAVDEGVPNILRLVIWRLSEVVLAAALAALAVGVWTGTDVLAVPRRVWAYVVLLYVLGPGLLVDAILKPLWGRARPADVVEFGGALRFTPPHVISGECLRNCSFTAGEVAGVVALAVSVMMILVSLRPGGSALILRASLAILLLLSLFVAYQRIAGGRHFLSDAIFSSLFVGIVALVLHAGLFRRRAT
jgi:lipid A 4'-phosphatase